MGGHRFHAGVLVVRAGVWSILQVLRFHDRQDAHRWLVTSGEHAEAAGGVDAVLRVVLDTRNSGGRTFADVLAACQAAGSPLEFTSDS